jgi:hypothetical protein
LCLSWGTRYPEPGLSNRALAAETLTRIKDYDYILVQIDVADAMSSSSARPDLVIGRPGVYINTYDVIREMTNWMSARSLDRENIRLTVMCHQTHWAGCRMILRKFKLSATRVPVRIPYDRLSYQWYTRSALHALAGKAVRGGLYLFLREPRTDFSSASRTRIE